MEIKYYTPSIEEFHIGFEYEALVDYYKQIYETFIVENTTDLIQRMETYDSQDMDWIRVKCLDRSDIESFGFIHKQYAGDGTHVLNFEYEEWYLNFWHNSSNPLVELGRDNYDDGFFGKCKNKSELKRILKQLDIKING
jgi:hypothetical protein